MINAKVEEGIKFGHKCVYFDRDEPKLKDNGLLDLSRQEPSARTTLKSKFFFAGFKARMLFFLAVLAIFLLFLVLFHFKTVRSELYIQIEKMYTGPKPLPVFGNSLEFLTQDSGGVYLQFQKICTMHPRFARIWLGPNCYIILYKAEDVEVVLSSTTQIKKSDVYNFLYDWIGTGLLTSYGHKWKSHRKIITPTFHFKILEDFIQVFNSNGSILLEKLSENAGKGTFNVYSYINMYALDNICETALGVKVNAQKDSESEYASAVKDIRNIISLRVLKAWLRSDFIFHLSQHGPVYRKSLDVLHKTTEGVIKRRKKELINYKRTPTEQIELDDYNQKERLAFLDLLILSGSMSDLEIREEVDTFMFEGHDTVTSGISFVLYALAHHQDIQERVYKEMADIFGTSDRDATWQDLQNMKYLDLVLKESQRLYPSVPLIGRSIDEDLKLSDGYFLPKGSYTTLNVVKLHRDPEVWPNPDQFNPDNFLPEATRARNPYAYIPFSAGPRNCIGQRFAMMEMRCCVSKIVRKFKINPSRDHNNNAQVVGQLILYSKNGINIELETRR